jgi:hypothetical protein
MSRSNILGGAMGSTRTGESEDEAPEFGLLHAVEGVALASAVVRPTA